MEGRPGWAGWMVQWRETSRWCHRRIVVGLTRNPSRRRVGSRRVRAAIRARSGQLGQPRAGRVRGDPEDVDATGGVLDDEERVQPLQGDGVDMEQVAGQDPVCLGTEELGPGGSGSPG